METPSFTPLPCSGPCCVRQGMKHQVLSLRDLWHHWQDKICQYKVLIIADKLLQGVIRFGMKRMVQKISAKHSPKENTINGDGE